MKSLAGVPLYYDVVRDDLPATHDFQGDDEEERLRLSGTPDSHEIKMIWQCILSFVQPTDSDEWVTMI